MARLEDIPKKQFFTVHGDYFDELSAKIQTRVEKAKTIERPGTIARYALRYVLPAIVIAVAVFYYSSTGSDTEKILASVGTEELIEYLQDTGLSTDELLESIELTPEELDAIEEEIYNLGFDEPGGFEPDRSQ